MTAAPALVASATVESVLLVLKIAFLVLLYLVIWRILRAATREAKAGFGGVGQESMILSPQEARRLLVNATVMPAGKLVVVDSPSLEPGSLRSIGNVPMTIGRAAENDLVLPGDQFASALHARLDPRPDGVWIEDLGSTNGTFINAVLLSGAVRLEPGDLVRVGETEFRFEP